MQKISHKRPLTINEQHMLYRRIYNFSLCDLFYSVGEIKIFMEVITFSNKGPKLHFFSVRRLVLNIGNMKGTDTGANYLQMSVFKIMLAYSSKTECDKTV
jgi:hypothetical protein